MPTIAAQDGEEDALGQELAEEAAPRRAQRETDRDLLLPVGGPRQQQVRDVGAGDEQHEGDRAQEQHQGRAQVADDRVEERLQGHALPGVAVGKLLGQAGGDGLHVGARAVDVTPGFSRPMT